MIPQTSKIRKRILGSSLSLPAHPSSRTLCVHYGARSEGGQKFLVDTHSPTPFPRTRTSSVRDFAFCPPERNFQKSASGFSRKKVRPSSRNFVSLRGRDFVQDRQPICKVSVSRLARGFAPRFRQFGGQVGKRIFKQFPRVFVF